MVLIIFSKMYKLRQKLGDVLMLHLKKENIMIIGLPNTNLCENKS